VLVALVSALLLVDVEGRYLRFIESLNAVEVELLWSQAQTEESAEKITLHFEAVFRNSSEVPMAVEALNTELRINGTFAGAPSITEGDFQVPPKGERTVPLQAVLWEKRAKLFQEAQASGQGRMEVIGFTRVRFHTGRSELKVKYDVRGAFPLKGI
jgi:LEA14-like dessication related protein